MDFAIPRTTERSSIATAAHRCPQCREQALRLHRRHVSPSRLGAPLVTEYWDCDFCDAHYQFTPAENRWKPISQ